MILQITKDVALIRSLHTAIFPDDGWENSDAYWVLREEGAFVGFCSVKLIDKGDAIFLSRAGVLREYRGSGIQRRMIRTREKWAKNRGVPESITYTTPGNWPSIKNLLLAGYHAYTPEWTWAGRDVIYWRRDL